MNFKTRMLNSSVLNALMTLSEGDKKLVVEAFINSMSEIDCDHDICNNVGKDIAVMIEDDDWEGLSNFLDHEHLVNYTDDLAV